MAGDWIKVECATLEKPEVLRTAEMLNMHRDQAVGVFMRYFVWLDANYEANKNASVKCPEIVRNVSMKMLDDVLNQPGFAACLVAVGWAEFDKNEWTLRVVNGDRHNGMSAKTRAVDAKRKAEARRDSVRENPDKTRTREEKRRVNTKRPEREKPRSGTADSAKPKRQKGEALTFRQWAERERAAGHKLVPKDHPVFAFADRAKIPGDYVLIAWSRFKELHDAGGTSQRKRQADWPGTFANAVKDNWGGLWRFDAESGACVLTAAGQARKRALDAESEADQQPTDGSSVTPTTVA